MANRRLKTQTPFSRRFGIGETVFQIGVYGCCIGFCSLSFSLLVYLDHRQKKSALKPKYKAIERKRKAALQPPIYFDILTNSARTTKGRTIKHKSVVTLAHSLQYVSNALKYAPYVLDKTQFPLSLCIS